MHVHVLLCTLCKSMGHRRRSQATRRGREEAVEQARRGEATCNPAPRALLSCAPETLHRAHDAYRKHRAENASRAAGTQRENGGRRHACWGSQYLAFSQNVPKLQRMAFRSLSPSAGVSPAFSRTLAPQPATTRRTAALRRGSRKNPGGSGEKRAAARDFRGGRAKRFVMGIPRSSQVCRTQASKNSCPVFPLSDNPPLLPPRSAPSHSPLDTRAPAQLARSLLPALAAVRRGFVDARRRACCMPSP